MKFINVISLVIVVGMIAFSYESYRADAYMQTAKQHNAQAMTPYLKPLTVRRGLGPWRTHRRYIKDTPENRKIYNSPWIISWGDGRLYSAPWM